MNRTKLLSIVGLALTLGFLFGPALQAFGAMSREKSVTLEIHGMI